MVLFQHDAFIEKNGRHIGTRITFTNSAGEYLTMELPIVKDQTVYWAAFSAKKALNASSGAAGRNVEWFIERYDAINEPQTLISSDLDINGEYEDAEEG